MEYLLLITGLVLILGGANFLTDGAAAVAKRLDIPEFIIGLTIVAVGTSTPELVVSVLSAIAGKSDVAVGNVVGSNLFNTLVIAGVCALVAPIALTRSNIRRDIPIALGASLLLAVFLSDRLFRPDAVDRIGRVEGIVMLLLYVAVLWYSIRATRRSNASPASDAAADDTPPIRQQALWLSVVFIVGGLAALVFGGELFLHHATALARSWGVSESVIAITLVAGGTSLPELASSVVSVAKGKAGMALGNIVGSNVANILLILGLSATINPLSPGGITRGDVIMVVVSALLLYLTAFTFRRKTIDRWEGVLFLSLYIGYMYYLIAH